MNLDVIKDAINDSVNKADKRAIKNVNNIFNALAKEEISNAKNKLNILEDNDSIETKELIIFYIKKKPSIRLKVSFEEFESMQKLLRSL